MKCENAQFAFPSFAANSVRNVRERERASSLLYLSLYLCVCVYVCECYLSIYPQIQTNLTVRSGSEVKFQKLPKGKQRKILQTSLALSLERERNGIEKEFLLEIIAHFAVKELLLPPSLSPSLPRSLEKLNFFHF